MNKVNRSCFLCPFKNWLTVCLSYILSTFLGERANDFILLSDNATWEWIPIPLTILLGLHSPKVIIVQQ